ncbi:MAG TPA: murein biosynthesis integral membrane protein MurJ [Aeromicrobium sp.]|nr:murein biosynthesis integral membrane protein MurJ [Aeromicrobium sp.]
MTEPDVARSSAWMALGTVVSRLTGFARLYLLAFTIGTHLDADLFNNANTIPNTLYILVAGGVFNVVLVPQMVRAMKRDPDGGEAYVGRVVTLGLIVLAVATVILLIAVPLVVRLVFNGLLFTPDYEHQYASARLLMLLCMPQVFFYGTFVLLGQVLNARGVFGPMMWAPIANNLVAIGTLAGYLAAFGSSDGQDGFTTGQAVLLGLGSTLGIATQAALLMPYLRRAGFKFRPRFDFRGSGLGHTLGLGAWTLGFIAANQVAFIVVQRLATRGTLHGADKGVAAAGSAVYEIGYLMSQLPHGVITVSLATAVIPTLSALAADHDLDGLANHLGRVLRLVLSLVTPLAVAAAVLGPTAVQVVAFGGVRANATTIGWTVAAFAPAMVAFAIHYLMLRGFYAMENTRTPFLIQLAVAGTNVVAALVFTSFARPVFVPVALALAFGTSYVVGAALSAALLPGSVLLTPQTRRFLGRLALACLGTAFAMLAVLALLGASGVPTDTPARALGLVALAGPAGALTYVLMARALGMSELATVVSRLRRRQ